MATRVKKKPIPELDKAIIRECKKNRIFSRTNKENIENLTDDDIFNRVKTEILNLTDVDINLYICDKIYKGDNIFLFHVSDTKVIVVNRDNVYNRLKNTKFDVNKLKLYFYDN
jgi:hypothetical protein